MKKNDFSKPSSAGIPFTLAALCALAILAVFSGNYQVFFLYLPLLVIYGVRFKNWVFYELINCKFKGIRSYNVSDVHHFKCGVRFFLIVNVLLATVGLFLYYFQILVFRDWVNCIFISVISWLVMFYCAQYLSLSKYKKKLIKFLSKDRFYWDAYDVEFDNKLRNQRIELNDSIFINL